MIEINRVSIAFKQSCSFYNSMLACIGCVLCTYHHTTRVHTVYNLCTLYIPYYACTHCVRSIGSKSCECFGDSFSELVCCSCLLWYVPTCACRAMYNRTLYRELLTVLPGYVASSLAGVPVPGTRYTYREQQRTTKLKVVVCIIISEEMYIIDQN